MFTHSFNLVIVVIKLPKRHMSSASIEYFICEHVGNKAEQSNEGKDTGQSRESLCKTSFLAPV